MANVGDIVLPGDEICLDTNTDNSADIVIGPGLRQCQDVMIAVKPGVLRYREPSVYWVDCHQKRYVPARGDNIIGLVMSKSGDVFRVDIGASEQASLSYLAFEGATKRNRPDVKVGDLMYARLVVANKDMEPELVCIDSNGKSSGFGVLRGGFMINTSTSLARKILSSKSELIELLPQLGRSFPFEIAVGMNGRLWVNGRSTTETLSLAQAISGAEFLTKKETKDLVRRLCNSTSGL